ncbi:MAG TPA: Fur family transcriptional regulator [Candidatus Kapabacteria bacterium]|nr:Fur family transcriptional regulator [Candidatus Kapabacteria bacterium]
MKTTLSTFIDRLKADGHRITDARLALLEVFLKEDRPLSVPEIQQLLKKRHAVNKTTVYREVEFLLRENIIVTTNVDEKRGTYELAGTHHHHIVCKECSTTEEIHSKQLEAILQQLEKTVAGRGQFANIRHTVELFGLCVSCQRHAV